MRIALANGNTAWGGGERWFSDAARALSARGHELTLLAREGTALYARFNASHQPTRELGRLADGLGDPPPELALCNSRRELTALLRCYRGQPPFRLVLRRGIDRPLHDNFMRRPTWRRLAAILVNSDATGATVRSSLPWFPADRIRRIYNPVSIEPDPPVRAPDGVLRIGAAGRLVRQKGFDVLLAALVRLRDRSGWSLEIAGEGNLRARLERKSRRSGLGDRVRFLGALDRVEPFYARVDAVVVPSRYEGFCFVAVEAALSGLPVVASDVSSLREIVIDGETGRLVPSESPEALARALEELMEHPHSARALGSAARRSAAARFDAGRLTDELEGFLKEVCAWDAVG